MAEKKYFSLPEAARELGVSADVLRRQYRSGRIPAIKIPGGQPRFAAESIEQIKQEGWPQLARPDERLEPVLQAALGVETTHLRVGNTTRWRFSWPPPMGFSNLDSSELT